jgi:Trypsin
MWHWSQFIIGGTEVQDFSQFAYQLSMRYVEVHVCGASIIAPNWALSAGKKHSSSSRTRQQTKTFF